MTTARKTAQKKKEALREIAETIFKSFERFSAPDPDRKRAAIENLLVKPGRNRSAERAKHSPRRKKQRPLASGA